MGRKNLILLALILAVSLVFVSFVSAEIAPNSEETKLDLALSAQSIEPYHSLIIQAFADSADFSSKQIILKIIDPYSKEIFLKQVKSGEEAIFEANSSQFPGEYAVRAEIGSLKAEKRLQIGEFRKVNAEITGEIMKVTNIGNIPYTGSIEIKIGEEIVIKDIKLGMGDSEYFRITAPDGTYEVDINDGYSITKLSGIPLTGNAIGVEETKTLLGRMFERYPIVWIFICIIIFSCIWAYYKKYRQEKNISGIEKKLRMFKMRNKGGIEIVDSKETVDKLVLGEEIRNAEQVIVLHGQKQQAGVIAIKVKHSSKGIANENIKKSLEYAYKNKAVSYLSGEYIILIFSPLVTKTSKNEETAIRTALQIDNFLKEHNQRFRNDVILYGIGVNCGELINKIEGKILQFASINKTINFAKKIADISDGDVLMSKEIHEKTIDSIKADKFAADSMDLFTIKRIVDKERSAKFINEFMRRNQAKS